MVDYWCLYPIQDLRHLTLTFEKLNLKNQLLERKVPLRGDAYLSCLKTQEFFCKDLKTFLNKWLYIRKYIF